MKKSSVRSVGRLFYFEDEESELDEILRELDNLLGQGNRKS